MKNALTIDIEDISHSRFEAAGSGQTGIDRKFLEYSLKELLDLLDRSGAKATFFILGEVAESAPDLVRLIQNRGHELASHGYSHRPVYSLKPEEFKNDLLRSLKVIENISGLPVLGFRAPYWSITNDSLWALDIIKECGLKYDSSISPAVTFLYGIKGASTTAYFHQKGFWEVPPTTFKLLGRTVIAGGGFYLRALPYWLTKSRIRYLNEENKFALVYLHPHELANCRIKGRISFKENFVLNFNKSTFKNKFRRLLDDFKFCPLKEALKI